MDMVFNGKTAVITGAGAGIGREYAIEFARRGANVVVNDLGSAPDGSGADTRAADRVVEEILSAGGSAVADYGSVATEEGARGIMDTAMNSFGSVDILVNNAGILRDRSLVKMNIEDWDQVMDVHLRGAFFVTRTALEIMRARNYGRLIMTTSTSGLFGNYGQSNYGAAKLGVVGFMNVIKTENTRYNIRVNAVAPHAASRMTEGLFPPGISEKLHPRFNVPMVVYLCHEECFENGSIYVMGAGWYGRAAIVCGRGVCIGDAKREISAEEIRENIAVISNLEDARPMSNIEVFQFMGPLLSGS